MSTSAQRLVTPSPRRSDTPPTLALARTPGLFFLGFEIDATGTVVARFAYGTRWHVPDLIWKSSGVYRVVTDERGSPRLVINVSTGAVVQRLEYDVWGNVVLDTAPGFQPFGFAAGLYDASTSLTRFGVRDVSVHGLRRRAA